MGLWPAATKDARFVAVFSLSKDPVAFSDMVTVCEQACDQYFVFCCWGCVNMEERTELQDITKQQEQTRE